MGSFRKFFTDEITRGYLLEHDEERYTARREKVYAFMKIPRELEKFMAYGFFQCTDSLLFIYTFLPLRCILATWALLTRPLCKLLWPERYKSLRILRPAEIVDLLKGFIIITCSLLLSYVDTSMIYHMIKSQSVIKLYLFYNMLEVADRLFSSFGQDTVDSLFWTATEPRGRKREHLGVLPHLFLALTYVLLHTLLVLLQATTLNVAINSSNKALLTIMMSNNFVELKGSVFKKFDKNNLYQLSCSDVRERFHLFILLFVVVLQTMKEYAWKEERFWVLFPDCLMVLGSEILVDWTKHAFVTRFNEFPAEIYRDYTLSLAYDLAQTKQKHLFGYRLYNNRKYQPNRRKAFTYLAFTDHADLVARRMGFIPIPLSVLLSRILFQSCRIEDWASVILLIVGYCALTSFRVLNNLVMLGKACDLIDTHQKAKTQASNAPTTQQTAPVAHVSSNVAPTDQVCNSPRLSRVDKKDEAAAGENLRSVSEERERPVNFHVKCRSVSHSPPRIVRRQGLLKADRRSFRRLASWGEEFEPHLETCKPMFSNSTVSLTSLCLNEEVWDESDAFRKEANQKETEGNSDSVEDKLVSNSL